MDKHINLLNYDRNDIFINTDYDNPLGFIREIYRLEIFTVETHVNYKI